ncbi:44992_t:CDS:2, partial [Gigaspora margarita]
TKKYKQTKDTGDEYEEHQKSKKKKQTPVTKDHRNDENKHQSTDQQHQRRTPIQSTDQLHQRHTPTTKTKDTPKWTPTTKQKTPEMDTNDESERHLEIDTNDESETNDLKYLEVLLKEKPDWYLYELQLQIEIWLDRKVCLSTIWKAIYTLGYTRKQGALCIDSLLAYGIQEGPMNTQDYENFIETDLLPKMNSFPE